uniref:Uncharacterized protein n=1 Tax=Anguilla anguilla TaxID=7936 RepID=A0A0E9XGS0_ANGAN
MAWFTRLFIYKNTPSEFSKYSSSFEYVSWLKLVGLHWTRCWKNWFEFGGMGGC